MTLFGRRMAPEPVYPRKSPTGRLLRPVGVVGMALALGGCGLFPGQDPTPASAGGSVAAAPSASATPALTDAAALGRWMSAAMRRSSTAAMKSSGTGAAATSVTGVVRYTPGSVAVQMTTGEVGGTEMVIVDDVAYLRTGKKVQGKNWLRFDGTGTDPASQTMGLFLAAIHQQSDPAAAAAGLSGVPLTLTGSHTVDGVVTTGYQFRQSGDQVFAGLPEAWRAQYAGSVAGASAVTEIWVDTEGLPYRNTTTSTVNGTTSTATVDFSHWGEPVTITAPPASEVTTLTG